MTIFDYLIANDNTIVFKWFCLISLLLMLYSFALFLVKEVYRQWMDTLAELVEIRRYYRAKIAPHAARTHAPATEPVAASKPRIVARKPAAPDDELTSDGIHKMAILPTLPNYRDLVKEHDHSKFYEMASAKTKAN